MTISKNATKLMAFVLTFAFVLMGLAYVPKEAQAAEAAGTSEETSAPEETNVPAVRVLGATLRLGDEGGKQSLRLAIEVSNASHAKACGIEITSRRSKNTVTVATDVDTDSAKRTKKHTDLYDKDIDADKVVYSAVITGIPYDNIGDLFDVKGYVKAVEAQDADAKIDSGTPVIKSVQGVVDVLREANPAIELNEQGQLLLGTQVLAADDPIFKELMTPTTLMLEPSINGAPEELKVGESATLTVSIKQNHNAQIKSIVWSVQGGAVIEQSDDKAAEASVIAVKEGSVKVYVAVTALDGQQEVTRLDMAAINIPKPDVPEPLKVEPTITGASKPMDVGETAQLTVSVENDNVTIENVVWAASGGAAVIEPDNNAKEKAVVTAVQGGTATVYAVVTIKEKNGEQRSATATAETVVNVNQPPEPFKINPSINGVPDNEIFNLDTPYDLTVAAGNSDATIENVEWSVRGSLARIKSKDGSNSNDAVFTAVESGKVTIYAKVTATRGNERVTDTAQVEVKTRQFGFNADETEYTLLLDENSLYTYYDGKYVCNEDGSVSFTKEQDNELGFQLPQKIYEKYKFRGIKVEYKDSTEEQNTFSCDRYFNSSEPNGWANNRIGDVTFKGESGEVLLGTGDRDYVADDKLSGFKFWSGTVGSSITITKVVFIVAYEYELPLDDESIWANTGNGGPVWIQVNDNHPGKYTINKDEHSVTINRNGAKSEFGFQLPKEIYSEHKYRRVLIEYKDSNLETGDGFRCSKYYDREYPYDAENCGGSFDNFYWTGFSLTGNSGKCWLPTGDKDKDDEKKLSGFKLWDGPVGLEVTITRVLFTDY